MLKDLVEMSGKYGKNPNYVLAGGGNTSFKTNDILYVKGSGISLSQVCKEDFVAMDRKKLDGIMAKEYPKNDNEREAAALCDLMNARMEGERDKRPSVETLLHNILPYKYVLHVHPALVNGLTCGKKGERWAHKLFGEAFVWVPIYKPGYALAKLCDNILKEYEIKEGKYPQIILLQNHGIFVAADSVCEIDGIMREVMEKLEKCVNRRVVFECEKVDEKKERYVRSIIADKTSKNVFIRSIKDEIILNYLTDEQSFEPLKRPFTPDHIVYCGAKFLYVKDLRNLSEQIDDFVKENNYIPQIIAIKDEGVFVFGKNEKAVTNSCELFLDAVAIAEYSKSFGGFLPMTEGLICFITNWEAEAYRKRQ